MIPQSQVLGGQVNVFARTEEIELQDLNFKIRCVESTPLRDL